jgi:RHS repeat-associated protein
LLYIFFFFNPSPSDLTNESPNAIASSYYSYDILGNVDTLVQDYGNSSLYPDVANVMNASNRFKKIVYDFDLVSGKVNQVSYQHGYADAFYHSYLYDAENRITNVQSSTDSVNWDNDAFYSYYKHGPLARTVLGQQQVQGLNYAYTLQGWLKAINLDPYTGSGFTLQPDSAGNVVANNAYNLLLNYYSGDYAPISNVPGPDNGVSTALGADSLPLFNGNISSMGVNIKKLNAPLLYSYQYDQLNRLTHMDAWKRTSTAWSALTASTDYQENVTYDPNGNILTYHRNRETVGSSNQMDQLQYNYLSGTNQLDHIYDTVSGVSNANDIATQSTGNYKYDSIGELVGDAASNITGITWTVYGKIASITKSTDTVIKYTYDPSGNRISKRVVHGSDSTVTWYVRDAQGNILSVYTYGDPMVNGGALAQTELDIYGSSRLGTWKRAVPVANLDSTVHNPFPNSGDSITFTRGNKLFELTNHLGNVLATISDKRYGVSTDDSTVVYYNPEVVGANDYYPFGMQQYARTYTEANVGSYRWGFNGKENDNEVKGTGNQIDYGMRVYDPRVGRFLSVDPLTDKYPELTPFQYASNDPINNVDIDGLEGFWHNFLYGDPFQAINELSWDDISEGAGTINNATGAGAVINGTFQAVTGRDPIHNFEPASRIDGLGNAIIGGILHASAVHMSASTSSAAKLEKQMAESAAAVTNKTTTAIHSTPDAAESNSAPATEPKSTSTTEANSTPTTPSKPIVKKVNRSGDQTRLRTLATDDKASSADRGWIKQEINQINRKTRTTIRRPPGKVLAHERGREAAKGYSYEHSNIQTKELHKLQHKHDLNGTLNQERPAH